MKTKILLVFAFILFSALSAFGQGGVQDLVPMPNQADTNLLSNPGFETDFTSWTSVNACATIDATVARTGSKSAKLNGCNTSLVMRQAITLGSKTNMHVLVTYWVKADASYSASTFQIQTKVAVHNNVNWRAARTLIDFGIGPAADDWIEQRLEIMIPTAHQGESVNLEVDLRTETGNIWIDDISVQMTWYPLNSFVRYPNFKGFVQEDLDPAICPGTETNEVCGVSEIEPPTALALGDTKLIVELASAAGCASGVLDTASVNPVTANEELWQLDGSSMTVDTDYFVCTELQKVSDSAIVATFPDWKVIKKNAAFWSGLRSYIDDTNAWVRKEKDGSQRRRLMWGTFVRYSGAFSCDNCVWATGASCSPSQSTAKDCYLLNIDGFMQDTPQKSAVIDFDSPRLMDEARARHTADVWISGSAINPTTGSDQLTPFLDAVNDYGTGRIQIMNNWSGYAISETGSPTDPSAPTISCVSTGGSIDQAWVYARVAAVKMGTGTESGSNFNETNDSLSDHNVTVLSGSTNKCTVTLPSCPSKTVNGYYVYAATNTTETEPTDATFSRQTNIISDCSGTLDLLDVINSEIDLPTTDATKDANRPSWGSALTDQTMWDRMASKLDNFSGAGYYACDECRMPAQGFSWEINNRMDNQMSGDLFSYSVSNSPTKLHYLRAYYDAPSQDIYPYGLSTGPDTRHFGCDNINATVFSDSGPNETTTETLGCVGRIDSHTDWGMDRLHEARFSVPVIQQWDRNVTDAVPYAALRQQVYKALIGIQNHGVIGGVLTWGWVDSLGMEYAVEQQGHTQALEDHFRLSDEMMDIEDVWLIVPDDSSFLGTGTIVSSVSDNFVAYPTATCDNFPGNLPYRWVAKQRPSGDQWIFFTNMCQDAYDITFTMVAPPSDTAVEYPDSSNTFAIVTDQFTVSLTNMSVHAVMIPAPKNKKLKGKVNLTGKVQ